MLSLLFSLWLSVATAQTLPPAPPDVTQQGEFEGSCGERKVSIKVYQSYEGIRHFRYSHNGKTFAVFIPPLAFALRADGRVVVFNPAETGESACEALEKSLDKSI